MGLRFRKSLKLAPGLRLNVGLRGLSMSLGPRGSSVNVGARGTYTNIGLPGTGVSTRTRIGSPSRSVGTSGEGSGKGNVKMRLNAQDGSVDIVAEDGTELPPRVVAQVRKQHAAQLSEWLHEKCDVWNKGIDQILGIHLNTPPPDRLPPDAMRRVYSEPMPTKPVPQPISFLARMFKSKRHRIHADNAVASNQYAKALVSWEETAEAFEHSERERLQFFDRAYRPEASQLQDYLLDILGRVEWPRETLVSLEVNDEGTTVMVDVDLPEIEDMPDKSATVAARGLKLNIKERSPTQRRREYVTHIHGVAFRVIGEILAAHPRLEWVGVSGFSQRPSRETGQVADDYLFSVRVSRVQWGSLNFARLADIDIGACLSAFDLRQELSSMGTFKPVVPFSSFEEGR